MESIENNSFDRTAETLQNELSGCSPDWSVRTVSSSSLFAPQVFMKRLYALLVPFLAIGMTFGLVAAQATTSSTAAKKKKKKKAAVKTAVAVNSASAGVRTGTSASLARTSAARASTAAKRRKV